MKTNYQTEKTISGKDMTKLFDIELDNTRYDGRMDRKNSLREIKDEISSQGFIGGKKIWAKI